MNNLIQLYLVSLGPISDGDRVRLHHVSDGTEIGIIEDSRDLSRRRLLASQQSRRGVEIELDLDVLERGQNDGVRRPAIDLRLAAEGELRFLFFVIEPSRVAVAGFGLKITTRRAGQRPQPIS